MTTWVTPLARSDARRDAARPDEMYSPSATLSSPLSASGVQHGGAEAGDRRPVSGSGQVTCPRNSHPAAPPSLHARCSPPASGRHGPGGSGQPPCCSMAGAEAGDGGESELAKACIQALSSVRAS